ncbi:MAG: hypothetical protein M0R06_04880, partial [Sphaerochaeta sp.]|nr:hypothetical protein [Sphaerochaeta sp.]
MADREGRLEYRPKRIDAEIFPYQKDLDIEGMLWKLVPDFISIYQVNGSKYIQINNFLKHQHIHPHEAKSILPPLADDNVLTSQDMSLQCNDNGIAMSGTSETSQRSETKSGSKDTSKSPSNTLSDQEEPDDNVLTSQDMSLQCNDNGIAMSGTSETSQRSETKSGSKDTSKSPSNTLSDQEEPDDNVLTSQDMSLQCNDNGIAMSG